MAVVFAVLAGAQLAGFLGMLIALPVAAIIVVLLRHAREWYEKSQLYDSNVVLTQHNTGSISIETDQMNVDIDLKEPTVKPLQNLEKSSKIDTSNNKDS